jgi:hypothetical protein
MAEIYRVIVWDKVVNEPYVKMEYDDLEIAKNVARNMKRHYIDDWGDLGKEYYHVKLQRVSGESHE